MKKCVTFKHLAFNPTILLILFLSITLTLSGAELKLLKIEEPETGFKGNKLKVDLNHLQAIIKNFRLKNVTGYIELADAGLHATSIVKLAKLKKGKFKWLHKEVGGNTLMVKFDKDAFDLMLKKVRAHSFKPGIRVQLIDSTASISSDSYTGKHFSQTTVERKKTILQWTEIIFAELPDLGVSLKYPVKILPGTEISNDTSIIAENRGTSKAENIPVELVISKDKVISRTGVLRKDNKEKDIVLENSRQIIPSLAPGESKTIPLEKTVKIPVELPPDSYYLGAVIDPENTINELDEENNIYAGPMSISLPAPQHIRIDMPDTQLVYNPSTYELKILCGGSVISDGSDWRKCRIKPFIHQIKHISWEGFHWEINTLDKGVFQIKGAKFCRSGGKTDRELDTKIIVKGGSSTKMPSEIIIPLPNTIMEFKPAEAKLHVSSHKTQIIHLPLWRTFRLKSHIYHFRHLNWKKTFWRINTFLKKAELVTDGHFTKGDDGTASDLNVTVLVE